MGWVTVNEVELAHRSGVSLDKIKQLRLNGDIRPYLIENDRFYYEIEGDIWEGVKFEDRKTPPTPKQLALNASREAQRISFMKNYKSPVKPRSYEPPPPRKWREEAKAKKINKIDPSKLADMYEDELPEGIFPDGTRKRINMRDFDISPGFVKPWVKPMKKPDSSQTLFKKKDLRRIRKIVKRRPAGNCHGYLHIFPNKHLQIYIDELNRSTTILPFNHDITNEEKGVHMVAFST